MNLISMTDFVLSGKPETYKDYQGFEELAKQCINYAEFLKQTIKIGIYIPCSEKGNPLQEPERYEQKNCFDEVEMDFDAQELYEYIQAKDKVLFKGWKLVTEAEEWFVIYHISGTIKVINKGEFGSIEDLIQDRFFYELTESAIKKFGLE